ncbi:MAG: hypothetical protein ACUVV0_03520, partial [Anaerolineae bacterium]
MRSAAHLEVVYRSREEGRAGKGARFALPTSAFATLLTRTPRRGVGSYPQGTTPQAGLRRPPP